VPLFWRYPNFLVTQCRIGQKKHRLDPFPRFDTIPTCDTQTNEHTAIAITQGQSSTNQLQCIRHASYFGWGGGKADGPKTEAKWPRVEAPVAKRFSCILEAPDGLSWNLLGAKFGGGHGPIARPTPFPSSQSMASFRRFPANCCKCDADLCRPAVGGTLLTGGTRRRGTRGSRRSIRR